MRMSIESLNSEYYRARAVECFRLADKAKSLTQKPMHGQGA